eukprot:CAMPEP_0175464206 /NCGR_PEP_ID=MMETSP0095-20121207/69631_1 /TAXON_ID=311494 /ORGANISM="Alexandrium monilatum, Strain CCMP3105" /LENGTH=341 /DNA_ID=CAMNT_0016765433 /DNA_START=154 /DNA_END=1176 /DNA_ORIENTATION=+
MKDYHTKFVGVVLFCCLPAMFLILASSWRLTRQHLEEIRAGRAAKKHERAVHIIALPSVYGLMAVSSFVKLFNMGKTIRKDQMGIAYARYETCIFVGDLYEAWSLYQFGKLTLELLDETIEMRQSVVNGPPQSSRGSGSTAGQARWQESSRDVVLSFTAVSSLAWLGPWLLVVVCVLQAGYNLWLWCFSDPASNWHAVAANFHKFSFAGMVASGAAIYNIHTIEQVFGHLMVDYSPLLKFLSVKVLVFFAFWQMKVLQVLRINDERGEHQADPRRSVGGGVLGLQHHALLGVGPPGGLVLPGGRHRSAREGPAGVGALEVLHMRCTAAAGCACVALGNSFF